VVSGTYGFCIFEVSSGGIKWMHQVVSVTNGFKFEVEKVHV